MAISLITLKDIAAMDEPASNLLGRMGMKLKIRYRDPNFPTLQLNEKGDWIDLKATKDYELNAGDSAFIDLGVAMKLPDEFEAWLVPRSGTFKKYGLIQTNGIGIIDNSFSGNNDIWQMPVYATEDTKVSKGDRLCQFRLVERMGSIFDRKISSPNDLYIIEVEQLDENDRGGFGSTGR